MLRFNKSDEFNLPVGNVDFNTNVVKSLEGYLDITSRMNIDLHALDFREFLKIINPVKEDFVYLDPPYLITGSEYNKIWNRDLESELYELVDQLNSKGVNFMLSNVVEYNEKTNDLLLKWSKKYRVIEIESNYINFNDNGRKKIREILVVNYA
jgi:DNA adenine methylase